MTLFLTLLALLVTLIAPNMAIENHTPLPIYIAMIGWFTVGCRVWLDNVQQQLRRKSH